MDTSYKAPKTEEFYRDCVEHCILSRIDMMPDVSWRRLSSDKPLKWMFENFSQSRQYSFIQKDHITEFENEKWRNKSSHIEAGFTIRIHNIDYMALFEIESDYLNYFIEKYDLEKQ